jgi:hypothetical protein
MVIVLAGAIALPACSSTTAPPDPLSALERRCDAPAAASRASAALTAAKRRYRTESRGKTIHHDLRQIASDPVLLGALGVGDLNVARAEANRQLVRHVVRIRVLRGSRLLVDANSPSFDVGGASRKLRSPSGGSLGRLEITVQDVIGFIKLIHKLNAAEVVVRSGSGRMRTSLPAAARGSLPRSGCTQVGARTYVVRSFGEAGFAGESLTIWVLTAA